MKTGTPSYQNSGLPSDWKVAADKGFPSPEGGEGGVWWGVERCRKMVKEGQKKSVN